MLTTHILVNILIYCGRAYWGAAISQRDTSGYTPDRPGYLAGSAGQGAEWTEGTAGAHIETYTRRRAVLRHTGGKSCYPTKEP